MDTRFHCLNLFALPNAAVDESDLQAEMATVGFKAITNLDG